MSSQQHMTQRRPRIHRLIAAQALIGLGAAVIAAGIAGREAALAAALGALTCLLPQAWFAWRVFGRGLEGDAGAMLQTMYRGEAAKLAAIVVLFVAIFRLWPEVPPLPLVLSFIAVQSVHWFAPLLLGE